MKNKLFLDVATKLKEKNIKIDEYRYKNMIINHYKVDSSSPKELNKELGDYYTINYEENFLFTNPKIILKELTKILNQMLKKYNKNGTTLIIGLGNSSILADAIGPTTTNKIMATYHYQDFLTIPKIALFTPEVIGKTGISSFKLIKMLVKDISPDTIIMIDSLATSKEEHLNTAIEISDAGIIPTSAIKHNKEINQKTFGIPIISIGVPTIFDINKKLYTTPNIKNIVEKTTDIIASSINSIFLY